MAPSDGEWREEAPCKATPVEAWFPEERNPVHTTAYKQELSELREFCSTCPFQRECLEDALDHSSSVNYGIYAGTTPQQRRKLVKELAIDIDNEES